MAATSYLTLAQFRTRTCLASVDIDAVEADVSGFTDARLIANSARIDARLRKRYKVPFANTVGDPAPEVVCEWLQRMASVDVLMKRGADPNDPTVKRVIDAAEKAEAELKEASDAADGLFDLPMRDDEDESDITKGGPLFYTERSPYVAFDTQRRVGLVEDETSRGR